MKKLRKRRVQDFVSEFLCLNFHHRELAIFSATSLLNFACLLAVKLVQHLARVTGLGPRTVEESSLFIKRIGELWPYFMTS